MIPHATPTSGAHVLLVEDDLATRRSVAANLSAHGYQIAEAGGVADALRSWEANRPDVILLDLGLPDADGTDLIRRVRRDSTTPILVLTARDAEPDKVEALEMGADDYVTKPFGLPELRARIGAVLRRVGSAAGDPAGRIALGPVVVDVARRSVTAAGAPVQLTPREYELLKTMVSQPGRLLTRGRLLRAVWGAAYGEERHYLHVYVSRLRRKLDEADPSGRSSALIVAEPGVGYRIAEADEAG